MSCQATGTPNPVIYWQRDTSRNIMYQKSELGRFKVTDDGSLIISGVLTDDAGTYHCNAVNNDGMITAAARLDVSGRWTMVVMGVGRVGSRQ